jgi:hypothetical protein
MKSKLILFLLSFIILSSCSNTEDFQENSINQKPVSEYYWYENIDNKKDSILFPVIVEIGLDIENIQGLETNNEEFRLIGVNKLYFPYTEDYIDIEGDTILFVNDYFWDFQSIMDENTNWGSDLDPETILASEKYKEKYNIDSVTRRIEFFDAKMFHEWDLRKYPFDNQKLRVVFQSLQDSSRYRFRESSFEKSSYQINNDLKDGFKIKDLIFKEEFIEYPIVDYDLGRKLVLPEGVFEIVISRTGSWVFIKLFFGGVLALVLSWLVFIIPTKDFASRIELSIGAVFAAVGNKYFVDSAVDSQVLTVADLFNNIIIFMVALNVALIIMKRNIVFKNKLINNTRTISRISIYTALILFGLLTIYTIS